MAKTTKKGGRRPAGTGTRGTGKSGAASSRGARARRPPSGGVPSESKLDTKIQRRLYARLYVENGGNATKAAEDAGYSPRSARTTGYRLLQNAEVQAEIEGLQRKVEERIEERTGASIEKCVRSLEEIRTADPLWVFDSENNAVLPLDEWPAEMRRCVRGFKVEQTMELHEDAETVIAVRVYDIKLEPRVTAIDQEMKHLNGYRRHDDEKDTDSLVAVLALARQVRETQK